MLQKLIKLFSLLLILQLNNNYVNLEKITESKSSDIGLRIVNGTDADIEDYPFLVSLRVFKIHHCGASMINSMWAITAGNCVYLDLPEYFSIQYGSTIISEDNENNVEIENFYVHPAFNNIETINDIALVKTMASIIISQYVILPVQFSDTMPGVSGTLIGWGEDLNIDTDVLQRVDLNIYSDVECSELHEFSIYPSNICAGFYGGGRGLCDGNNGSPLLVNGIQVGIASWSMRPCTVPPFPGVYTQVSYYREWIRLQTGI